MVQLTQSSFGLLEHPMVCVYIRLLFIVDLRASVLVVSGARAVQPVPCLFAILLHKPAIVVLPVLIVFTKRMLIPGVPPTVSPFHLRQLDIPSFGTKEEAPRDSSLLLLLIINDDDADTDE